MEEFSYYLYFFDSSSFPFEQIESLTRKTEIDTFYIPRSNDADIKLVLFFKYVK